MELGWQERVWHGPCCSANQWWGQELSWGRCESGFGRAPWPRCGDGRTCWQTAGHPRSPLSGCSFPCLQSPSVYQQPQGTGKRGCQRLACAGRGPARSGSWEGPIQRTVSLVIVIRVILQQLESCFCAGVAWLYGSEGGERNTGNGSDGSRIISWRERRAADATEGNKDRDSEGFIHDFVLETAQTNRLNPSLQHTYLPSGTSPPTQSPCPELWAAGRPLFGDTQRQL